MSNIIIFPRGQLSEADRARIDAAGLLVVEADEPHRVVQVLPAAPIVDAGDLFMSALRAITKTGVGADHFAAELQRRLLAREDDAARKGGEG